MTRPLILFSGGLDSTTLLYDRLVRGDNVDVLYIDCGQGPNKIAAEKAAAINILDLFQDFKSRGLLEAEVETRHMDATFAWSRGHAPSTFSFAQVLPWLVTAMQYVDSYKHSKVEIAYCMGDQISSELYKLQAVWAQLWSCISDRPLVPLEFPFLRQSKQYFLERLPSYLRDLTWVCEIPVDRHEEGDDEALAGPRWGQCWKCMACKRSKMEQELYAMSRPEGLRQDKLPAPKPPAEDQEPSEDKAKEAAPSLINELVRKGYYDNCPTVDHEVDVVHLADAET